MLRANITAHNRMAGAGAKATAAGVRQGFLVVFFAYKDITSAEEEYDQTVKSVQ